MSFPSGDLAKSVGPGFHAGFSLGLELDARNTIGLEGNFHMLAEKTSMIQLFTPITFRQKAAIGEGAFYVQGALVPGARPSPYFKGGFSLNRVETEVEISSGASSSRVREVDIWPGVFAGLGVSMNPIHLEVLYRGIHAKDLANMFTVALGFHPSAGR